MDFTPNQPLVATVAPLVAADTTFLGAVLGMKVALAKSPFTPGSSTNPVDYTEADFTGYAQITATGGNQLVGIDPVTGQYLIQLIEPAGGWQWQVITNTTNLPQTIFGAYLLDNAGAVVIASALLDSPITLTAIAQIVNLGKLNFRLPLNPLGP